jgi:circadian clock protein KaiC
MHFAATAAAQGEKVYYFLFEENLATLMRRAESLGMDFQRFADEGKVVFRQIDPAELSPGEFVHMAKVAVEKDNARVIVIDSLNGYLQAMPAVSFLTIQLHELQAFLAHHGAITLMTVAQHGLLGQMQSPVDVTYLADSVLLLRYFEQAGEIRKAISMVKRREGHHETAIRELKFGKGGMVVGEPLRDFHGILTGVPVYSGKPGKMLETP